MFPGADPWVLCRTAIDGHNSTAAWLACRAEQAKQRRAGCVVVIMHVCV